MLEQGSIDKPLNFDVALIQVFSYQCVHLIHVKVFYHSAINIYVVFVNVLYAGDLFSTDPLAIIHKGIEIFV